MEINELLQNIGSAFQDVPRASTSLRQFWLTDEKGLSGTLTPDEWRLASVTRTDANWTDIAAIEIETYGCQLAHMPGDAFSYYLPAYMSYAAAKVGEPAPGDAILSFTIYGLVPSAQHPPYSEQQYSLLTSRQRESVASFLTFVSEHSDEYVCHEAQQALRHWAPRGLA